MSGINKAYLNSIRQLCHLAVGHFSEMLHNTLGILYRILRRYKRCAGALALTVCIFSLHLLYMCTVQEHYRIQILRCQGAYDSTVKAINISLWYHTCMINVSMCKQDIVDFLVAAGQICIFINIPALFHSAINYNLTVPGLNQMLRARNLMISSDECKFHSFTPLFIPFYEKTCFHYRE